MHHRPIVLILTLASSVSMAASLLAQTEMDHRAVATKLVERMALQRGERVLLVATPGLSDELVSELRARIQNAGAADLGVMPARGRGPDSWSTDFTKQAEGKKREALATQFADVDLAVMMPGATPNDPAYAAMQDVLRSGHGRTIHFHWAGAYSVDGRLLDVTPSVSSYYQRALLRTDYVALAGLQQRLEEAMRHGEVHVTTPAGTDIRFRIGDRPVTRQDGDASASRARLAKNLIDREIELPAGAVRVAPVEETVEGRIAIPSSIWRNEHVEGLILTFAAGRVTAVRARTGGAAVDAELTQSGDASRAFREFALGLNPLLAIPDEGERWIPYYGYGAGVVRLSLGDNTELGGKVTGGYVRWNFFTDATVTVGGEVWVRDGKLVPQ